MARAKPRGRADSSDAHARVRALFENPFEMLALEAKNFHDVLPTLEERRAFAAEFRGEYLKLAGFIASESYSYPASTEYEFNVFKRDWEFFDHLPAGVDLPDLPDLRNVPPGPGAENHYRAMARARGGWWKANRLEMTDRERAWWVRNP